MDRRDALKTTLAAIGSAAILGPNPARAHEQSRIKRIATEEHFLLPDYIKAVNRHLENNPGDEHRAWFGSGIKPLKNYHIMGERIADFDRRLEYMDRDGISMQILSLMQPGVQIFEPDEGTAVARNVNDQTAAIVTQHPGRFAALATIAPQAPQRAADELDRAVNRLGMKGAVINSHTKNQYLDDERFWPIFEAAESLQVPIYLHPRDPAAPMYDLSDYGGLQMIWGFAADASLHSLRLILSGVFDRFPKLQFVLGHLGEGIPFALDRIDNRFAAIPPKFKENLPRKIERRPSDYFRDNFTVTSSGQNWEPAVRFCQQVLGTDNVMFGVDYPFEDQPATVTAANDISMEHETRERFFHQNACRVFGLGDA